ncbi:hypothetical protein SERLA73DRAFT_83585 [Serpula lacrymans var. lacrymans S7.3]|uniref:Uncharacterized protein n=2 Tax=Serpula lacrymans var. lacrymans TaxID=341189 RepID=F8PK79_SERL3|nr:uncharacterized protein SERLADRAFT_359434 [Serpula lacrymans var. lacrymans S7.9]EGO03533.1 hypothetical protein SERLA73DRAFT_83585 [Serpula lacrymans var. lacrymans S7.3]EGO29345.1 hypothetical protein SERLADRAFT_359434 [Serpula lacrymans var. lacrymans S7.9]
MSSYESLRAAGTTVVCLSPWGDSSPLLLPCLRFRDLAVHGVVVATGGVAAIAAPVMGPVSDAVLSTVGDGILVEMGLHTGFELTAKAADDLIGDGAIKKMVPLYSTRLETTNVKTILITLKYKHTVEDASLGFFRSSLHKDNSLFSVVKDYFGIEKGWFSPYLFASGRRPIIPRTVKPDVLFCHGPFLPGDYKVGETLLAESASVITLCPAISPEGVTEKPIAHHHSLSIPDLPSLTHFSRSRTPSPEPTLAPPILPLAPRRIVILVLGMKPHRLLWTTSARPSESVIHYQLLNGCPAIVVPAKVGAPLIAWDGLTLEDLWKVSLPNEGEVGFGKASTNTTFVGIVNVLFEYLDLCIDWERVIIQGDEYADESKQNEDGKKASVWDALALLVAGAVRSGRSKEVKKEVDKERSGIAMWRIP